MSAANSALMSSGWVNQMTDIIWLLISIVCCSLIGYSLGYKAKVSEMQGKIHERDNYYTYMEGDLVRRLRDSEEKHVLDLKKLNEEKTITYQRGYEHGYVAGRATGFEDGRIT